MRSVEFFALAAAVAFTLNGAWMLFFSEHFQAGQERRHQARLAARVARGSDAYFEELRSLEAYAPRRLPRDQQKLAGGAMLVIGGFILALWFAR